MDERKRETISIIAYKDQREALDMLARAHGMGGISDYMREIGLEHVRKAEKETLERMKSSTPVFTITSKILDVTLFSLETWKKNGEVKQ